MLKRMYGKEESEFVAETIDVEELVRNLVERETSFHPWLTITGDCILSLEQGHLERLFKEPTWGGIIICCNGIKPYLEHQLKALEIARRAAPDLPLFVSMRIEAIMEALGEYFWEHERYRVLSHEPWEKLLPPDGYALALSVSNPLHCITLCTPRAKLEEHLSLPVGENELHIWRKCQPKDGGLKDPSSAEFDWRVEQLHSILSQLRQVADGVSINCSTLIIPRRAFGRHITVRRMPSSVFESALSVAASECGVSEAGVLRSICYDPSIDANRVRFSFWRAVARAYRTSLILPIMHALGELGMSFSLDMSGWDNPLSPFITFGDVKQAFRLDSDSDGTNGTLSPGEIRAPSHPVLIVNCNAILLQILRALIGRWWAIAVRVSGDEEVGQSLIAAKHGAQMLVSDAFFTQSLPEDLMAHVYLNSSWWLESRMVLNATIGRILCFGNSGRKHSPAAVVITVQHLLSKLYLTRVRSDPAEMISAWSELIGLLERFHLSCDWITDEDLAEGAVAEHLPLQVAMASAERYGICIGDGCYTTILLPTPSGLSKAAWIALSKLHNVGGSIFLIGAPPLPSEVTPETELLKWVHSSSRSYEARFIYAKELDMPLDDLSPVTHQNPHGGCLGMFDWRICPDKVEAQNMLHRMLNLSIRPVVETHHGGVRTLVRWFGETPAVLAWNSLSEPAKFHLLIRCIGRVIVWQAHFPERPMRYPHYAIVEDEIDVHGAMCVVVSLELPPRQWCIIFIPPGAEACIAGANFRVTEVNLIGKVAKVKGFTRTPNLKATICVGRRMREFEAHIANVPSDESELDKLVKLNASHFEAICAGKVHFNMWRARFRFPWSLLHRITPWQAIPSGGGLLRIVRGERLSIIQLRCDVEHPPHCKRFMFRVFGMPKGWLALEVDGDIVAVNAVATIEHLRKFGIAKVVSVSKSIDGCDTGWLTITQRAEKHEIILHVLAPEDGIVKLPEAFALFELAAEDISLAEGITLALSSLRHLSDLHIIKMCGYDLSIPPIANADELLLELDSDWERVTMTVSADGWRVASSAGHVRLRVMGIGETRLKVNIGELCAKELSSAVLGEASQAPLKWRVAFGISYEGEVNESS